MRMITVPSRSASLEGHQASLSRSPGDVEGLVHDLESEL